MIPRRIQLRLIEAVGAAPAVALLGRAKSANVVYNGKESYPLNAETTAVGLREMIALLQEDGRKAA